MTKRRGRPFARPIHAALEARGGYAPRRPAGRLVAGAGLIAGALALAAPLTATTASAAVPRSTFSRIVPCSQSRAGGGVHGLILAINGANAAGGGSIRLAGGCVYRLSGVYGNTGLGPNGPDGLPPITTPIMFYGRSATIERDATAPFRILEVNKTGNFNARRLSLVNGLDESGAGGGAIYNEGILTFFKVNLFANDTTNSGGGLYNAPGGVVNWNEGTVSGNSAGSQSGVGGGIYSDSKLMVMDTSIASNVALAGGGIYSDSSGTLAMNGDSVSGNQAQAGAGVYTAAAANLDDVTIAGNGSADQTILGGGVYYQPNTNAQGSLTVTGGTISANGAIFGGGVFADGFAASLVGTSVTGNTASSFGGGIFNSLQLSLRGVRLTGNTATQGGGGVANDSTLSITGGLVAGNTALTGDGAVGGGGIFNDSVLSSVANVTIRNNSALSGGGLYNNGTVTSLATSTFSSNTSSQGGAGLYNDGTIASAHDLTFSGNVASGNGGGIDNDSAGVITSLQVSTLTGDSAAAGGEIASSGSLNVAGSIFAAASGGDCSITGTFTDSGFNLGSDGSCPFTAGTSNPSSTVKNLLAPLANNGGPTETVALISGNPAIGGITSPPGCSSVDGGYGFDQRGVPRPANCDIGSFQTIATTTVVSASDTSVAAGTKINLYATVTPHSTLDGSATGQAAFYLNGGTSPIGMGTMRGGNPNLAIFTVALPAGTNVITAKYLGATGFGASTSSNSVTVNVS